MAGPALLLESAELDDVTVFQARVRSNRSSLIGQKNLIESTFEKSMGGPQDPWMLCEIKYDATTCRSSYMVQF